MSYSLGPVCSIRQGSLEGIDTLQVCRVEGPGTWGISELPGFGSSSPAAAASKTGASSQPFTFWGEWIFQQGRRATIKAEGDLPITLKPHWPRGASGITIGFGYDMKEKSEQQIKSDLVQCGVNYEMAEILKSGSGRSASTNPAAEEYLKKKFKLHGVEIEYGELKISEDSRESLFNLTYPIYQKQARRLVEKWCRNGTLWNGLHPALQAMLVDLHYRGDFGRAGVKFRTYLQESVEANDPMDFAESIEDLMTATMQQVSDRDRRGVQARFLMRISFVKRYASVK
jgi:hypothetical protein